MKKKDRTYIYLGFISALMLTSSALILDEKQTDHTEKLCTTTKFLNMIDKTGELGVKHQLAGSVSEKDVTGVRYVDHYIEDVVTTKMVEPIISKKDESYYSAPTGYKLVTEDDGKTYAVRTIKNREVTKPLYVTVDNEQIPIAPTGYVLETDELGLVYAVKTTVTEERIEAPGAMKSTVYYNVPDGYELETDELGNVYGKTEEVTKEDLGPAIISTYKNGKTKKLLLNKN